MAPARWRPRGRTCSHAAEEEAERRVSGSREIPQRGGNVQNVPVVSHAELKQLSLWFRVADVKGGQHGQKVVG